MQFDLLAERNHADDGGGAAGGQHGECLFGGFLAAQHLKRVMHAAIGEIAHLLHHVAVAGIDDVGGAELGCQLQLGGVGIDRDDAAGAGDLRAIDRGHADSATADHHDGFAGGDLGGVHHRAIAGDDAAADQRRQLQRHVLADFDDGILVHQHLLGKGGKIEKLMELLRPGPGQPVGLTRQHLHGGVGTQHRSPGRAIFAGAAEHRQAGHDVVAGFHIGHVGADLLDDTSGFVAKHRRQRMRVQPFHEMQIGMTEAGHSGADQHLARPGLRQADLLDHQRLVDLMQDGGLHFGYSPFYLLLAQGRHSLRRQDRFANLGHSGRPFGQQMQ
jgi:hypothetical protein